MKIFLVAVGRMKASPEKTLYEHYTGRLSWPIKLKEIELKKETDIASRKTREGEALLAAVPERARIVALDERGKPFSSEEFAKRIGTWQDSGEQTIAFLIGGADGLDKAVRERADLILSFGALTWPHMLVRGLLAEQLYRAQSILSGHPYHRA
jgi:23S rRNA (pseudouridine1915-N3)-methyltransferase